METDCFDTFSKMQGLFQRCLEEMKKFHDQSYDYFFSILPMEAFSKIGSLWLSASLEPQGQKLLGIVLKALFVYYIWRCKKGQKITSNFTGGLLLLDVVRTIYLNWPKQIYYKVSSALKEKLIRQKFHSSQCLMSPSHTSGNFSLSLDICIDLQLK